MAGPWERYANNPPRPAKPWERYSQSTEPVHPKRPAGFGESFSQGFKRSLPETKSLLAGAGAAAAGAVGADGLRDAALDTYREIQEEEVAPNQNAPGFREAVVGDGSIRDWAGDTLGNFAGQALQSATTGLIGAGLSTVRKPGKGTITGAVGGFVAGSGIRGMIRQRAERMVAEQMAKGATREVAEAAGKQAARNMTSQIGGATLATTGLNIAQETGGTFAARAEDAAAAGEELNSTDALRAIGAGAVGGTLDTAAEMLGVGRFLKGASASPSLARRIAAGAAAGGATEGATEAAQQAISRFGAQRDLTSPEAVGEYIDSAAAGALGGGVMGGASGIRRPARPTATVQPAGEITRVARPQAAVVPTPPPRFDGAAPGTLSDAANAIPTRAAPPPLPPGDMAAAAQAMPEPAPRRPARPQPDMFQRMLAERGQPAAGAVTIGADGTVRPARPTAPAEVAPQGMPEVALSPSPESAPVAPPQIDVPPVPEQRQPSTPPINMDPTTGEMLGADAEAWPAAAEHQQPARIIEALVADASRRRGRPPAIRQIAQTYNVDEGTARALRVAAVDRFTQQSLPQPQPARADAEVASGAPAAPADAVAAPQSIPEAMPALQADQQQAVDAGVAPMDAPAATAAPAYDESPDVLETDITPPSGGAFESQGAAELAARRAGANARVMRVGGGFVVRTPAQPAPDLPAAAEAAPQQPQLAGEPAAPAVPEPQGAPAPSQPAAALPAVLPSDPVPSAEPTTPMPDAQGAPSPVRAAAAEAATSPENDLPQPTQAQKEAGNYKKGHVRINGYDISIENPAGSQRDPKWPPLKNHYGYFKRTVGKDKDHVDVFMTDRAEDASLPVFVVDQVTEGGKFDEHKVVMGATDEADARATYLANYSPGWKGLGAITQMTQDEFKAWVNDPAKTKRPAARGQQTPPVGATPQPAAPALNAERYNARIVPDESETAAARSRPQADQDLVRIDGRVSGPAWTSATSIRFIDGRPARIYRGSADGQTRPGDFERVGAATGHPSAGLGVWFSSDRADASRYGQVGEYFLDIRNPKIYTADDAPEFDSVEEAAALRTKLINEGHDGITFDFRQDGGPLQMVVFRPAQIHVERAPAAAQATPAPAQAEPQSAPTDEGLTAAEVSPEELEQLLGAAPPPAEPEARPEPEATPADPAAIPKTRTLDGVVRYVANHPDTLKAYFVPGRIVPSYGNGQDRVISLDPPAKAGERWSVKVIGVDKDGNALPDERTRAHSTLPTDKELRAALGPPKAARAALVNASAKPRSDARKKGSAKREGAPQPERSTPVFSKAEAGQAPNALPMSRAQALKRELTKGWGENAPNVVLVESAEDLQRAANLPAAVLDDPSFYRAEGLFNGRKTVWLNLAQLRTEQRFADVLTHEALGHYGVENVIGAEQWAQITDAIAGHRANGTGARDVRAAVAQVEKTQPGLDAQTFAKEVIAVMAENGANNGLIRRVYAAIRAFLRKIMPSMSWTDTDLRGLLSQAESFLRSGRPLAQVRAQRTAAAFSKAELVTDGRGRRALEMGGERFVERSGSFYLANAKGEARDFMALGEATEAAERVGGEVLADTPSEGDRPTWSVVAPAGAVRAAEVGGMSTMFSKAAPGDVLKDIEAVMGVGNDESALQRARAALADMVPAKIKDQFRGTWLGALTTRHLTELGSDYFTNMRLYSDYLSEMGADRNKLQAEGEALAESVRKWAGKNAPAARALFDLMHESTIDGVDPSKDYQPLMLPPFGGKRLEATQKNLKEYVRAQREVMLGRGGDSKVDRMNDIKAARAAVKAEKRRRGQYAPLVAKWSQLTPEAQQFYRDMRDAYAGRSDAVEDALVARINDTDAPDNRKRQLINVIRQQFETHRLQGVYFPLQRFGQFFVAAERDGAQTFLMFERLTELERAVKDLRARGFNITAQGKKTEGKAKDAPSGTFVADVIEQLKKSGVSETTQDQIYQIYLEALPELSMRKHSIHRKAIPGFDPDAVRAFAFNMHHGAHQLARLRYSHKLQDTLNLLRDQQDKARRDPGADTRRIAAGDAIIEELGKRHEWIMNPTDSAIASFASSLGFVYYLGLTPAAALVNLSQTALVSFPYLASRYGGKRAMNMLLAAGRDSIRTLGNIEKKLTDPEERRAYQVLQQMGAIDKTQAHNLAGIAENGLKGYSPAYARTMEIIGKAFHKTEVVNRETTGLAAFRLARADGKGFDEAVRIAADVINDTHFDYSNQNRARYMQSGTAKVLLMFRQYSLNMTWHLGRMVWQATKGESPEVKALARRNLVGILGMSALFSGTMGLPMMGVVTGVLNSIAASFGDDDEKWDAETEFRKFLADMFGEMVAETVINGVANQLTGADIAGRVSLSQLWFRDADRELDGRGAYYNLLEQAAGPMGGILKNVMVGKQLIDEGHLWRGVETMLPKAIKDPVKSIRYMSEGVNTLKGDPIMEDLSLGQTLLQLSGFTPSELSRKYDRNRTLKNYEDFVEKRRDHLMNAYAMAVRLGDADAIAAAWEQIGKFNQTWPQIAITPEVLRKSARTKAMNSARAEDGIVLNPKIAAAIRAQVDGEN
jgi:hypothetical protein